MAPPQDGKRRRRPTTSQHLNATPPVLSSLSKISTSNSLLVGTCGSYIVYEKNCEVLVKRPVRSGEREAVSDRTDRVVYVGHKSGIYTIWEEAEEQINGYRHSKHERFKLFDEAQEALCKFHEDSYVGGARG